jgi:endonuclease/exonuclease/phosphatase family metal-dependent hydrolase
MICRSIRLAIFTVLALAAAGTLSGCSVTAEDPGLQAAQQPAQPGEYLFCHWNVENFFDDKLDKRHHKADKEFDEWFAGDKQALQLKLDKLTEALLKMNGGKGPDILAICEVESPRAADLLMEALNKKLEARWHYQHVLMKDLNAGRHIAPAILTRLPVAKDKTRLHGKMLRILEGHIVLDGKELVVLATHWTSRIQATSEASRDHYADTIYGVFKEMYARNPKVDVIVCGDFNDTPHDDSVVKHLHGSSDLAEVKRGGPLPLLYNLFGDKDAAKGYGTHYYKGKWFIFDQILVSPDMLDGSAWVCDRGSVQTFNSLYRPGDTHRAPWRFGDENFGGVRGYSDHFPVTVKLRVK